MNEFKMLRIRVIDPHLTAQEDVAKWIECTEAFLNEQAAIHLQRALIYGFSAIEVEAT